MNRLVFLTTVALMAGALPLSCGDAEERVGTLVFSADGEDFIREGFVSEDGWRIDFEKAYVNVYGPTAYQVVEQEQALTVPGLRHGGHPHEDIPDGTAHVSLSGEYLLALKAPPFEVDRVLDAPIGNYNRLAFTVEPIGPDAEGLGAVHLGHSIVLAGNASRPGIQDVAFSIRFTEKMHYSGCGPNGDAGVLAEGAEAEARMTFHFDHIFGDQQEGPADPEDPEAVNSIAIGFGPFAALGENGVLDIDQAGLVQRLDRPTLLQLIEAIHTLGHSGEAHCHLD